MLPYAKGKANVLKMRCVPVRLWEGVPTLTKEYPMKILSYGKDGGKDSTVWGLYVIEIKCLFSIVILCFEKGSRENFHSHAFNAWTWFLKGEVKEQHVDGRVLTWKPSWKPKRTPRDTFHRVHSVRRTWAVTIRGPWVDLWLEYNPFRNQFLTLTHGRKILNRRNTK